MTVTDFVLQPLVDACWRILIDDWCRNGRWVDTGRCRVCMRPQYRYRTVCRWVWP